MHVICVGWSKEGDTRKATILRYPHSQEMWWTQTQDLVLALCLCRFCDIRLRPFQGRQDESSLWQEDRLCLFACLSVCLCVSFRLFAWQSLGNGDTLVDPPPFWRCQFLHGLVGHTEAGTKGTYTMIKLLHLLRWL